MLWPANHKLVEVTVTAAAILLLTGLYAGDPFSWFTGIILSIGLILVAMAVYFGTAFAIGGASLGMLRRNLKRGKGAPPAAPTTGED